MTPATPRTALAALLLAGAPASHAEPLVIARVTVIDGTERANQPDRTVVIEGGRIAALHDGGWPPPRGAQVVDGRGRFLIPGLWDMHVHALRRGRPEVLFPLFLENGVTSVRDMGASRAEFDAYRAAPPGGPAPRVWASGPPLDGPRPTWPMNVAVATADDARRVVSDLHRAGVDFVKVYNLLPRDVYLAVADAARAAGLPFAGHVPFAVSAREAVAAGQASIEHLNKTALACSSAEEVLDRRLREATDHSSGPQSYLAREKADAEAFDTHSAPRAEAFFAEMKARRTAQVPTLVLRRSLAAEDPVRRFADDPRLRDLPQAMRAEAVDGFRRFVAQIPADALARSRALLPRALRLVGAMHAAGVTVLPGTDTPGFGTIPGHSLHDELALLVRAGLTPAAAIRAATRDSAAFMGQLPRLGTIEVGKEADLVLLSADPTREIANSRRIEAVIRAGRLVEPSSLPAGPEPPVAREDDGLGPRPHP